MRILADPIIALRDILQSNWSKPPEPSIEDIADLDRGDAKRVRMLDSDVIRIFETAHNEAQPELLYDYVNEHVNITIDIRSVDSRERLSELRNEVRRIIHGFRKGDGTNFDRAIFKTRTDLSDRSKKLFRYTLQYEIVTFSLLASPEEPIVNPASGEISGLNTYQSYDGDLVTLAAMTPSDGVFIVGSGANWVAESGATARASLGLGSMATQNSDAVSITGGSIGGVSGVVYSVAAGTGLTGTATSGAITLNVGDLTISELAANSLQTSSESFADNDTSLMTSAAIQDKIQSFGFAVLSEITSGVDLTGGTGILIQNEQNTASGDYSATVTLDLKDEDDFASNSAVHAASQQSVKAYVDTRVSNLLGGAPAALDTLDELAAAINDDANFTGTVTTALGNRVRVDTNSQGLTSTQQSNARANIGLNAGSVPSAGTGIDISGTGEFSVDVSDFMGSGANNRVLTATGTDAFQGEATLTYDGQTLRIDNGGDEVITIGGGGTGYQSIELGGDTGAYIDLKSPNSDDFDIRIITTGNGGEIVTASPLTFKTSTNNDDITFAPHGSGKVKFGSSGFTLPTADGSANQILKTDGSGALTFQDDLNHIYAISSATVTGGANIVLTASGSGSGTDTVKITGGTNTTVSQSNDEITIVSADTTYSVSTATSGSDARIVLTEGGSGSGTDFVTLAAGSNVTISETGDTITIGASSAVTYDFLVAQTSGDNDNPALRLDPSSGSNDDVTIVGGTNVTVTRDSNTQLTIASTDTNTQLSTEQVQDIVGAMVDGGTETNIAVTYDDTGGKLNFVSTDTNTQLTQEQVEDFVAGVITAGSNITKTYDDAAGTLTLAATDTNTQLSTEEVQDIVGAMVSSNTETNISVTYDDTGGKLNFVSTDTNTQLTLLDEDDFSSNSATAAASQQSIKAYVDGKTASIVDSAPAALDTLNELAAALNDDASFSTTTATSLGNRLRIDDNQSLTSTQQAQGLTNLGITASLAEINILDGGLSASDIPSLATSKITSGTFANARISQGSVTQHQAALSITESQISDLGSYITAPRTVTAGGNTLANGETLAFTAGSNVTITESAGAVTIAATDTNTTYGVGNGIGLSSTTFFVNAGNGLAQTSNGLQIADPATLDQLTESTDATDDKILLWDESASSWKYMTIDDLQDSIDTASSGSGAVSAVANGANNRIATFSSADALNGEANLVFDGTSLGIGTASPAFPLHLKYTDNDTGPEGGHQSGASGTVGANAQGGGLYIENASQTDGSYAGITFRTDTADARIAWQSVGSSLVNEGQLSFYLDTNDADNASPSSVFTLEEVLRLRAGSSDSDSNQGFNSVDLPVNDARLRLGASQQLELKFDGSHTRITHDAATDSWMIFKNEDGAGFQFNIGSEKGIEINKNDNVELYFNNVKRIETTSGGAAVTGSLGLGTTSPAAKLDSRTGSGFALIAGADVNATTLTDNTRKFARFGAPHYDTDEEPVTILTADSDSAYSRISIGGGTSAGNAPSQIFFHTGANTTTLGNNSATAAITSTGLGIGTTSPGHKLHVASPADDAGDYAIYAEEGNDNYAALVNRHSANRRTALFYRNIHADYTAQPMVEMHNDHASDDQTVLKITQDGSGHALTATGGNVGIGTTSPAQTLDVSGNIKTDNKLFVSDSFLRDDGANFKVVGESQTQYQVQGQYGAHIFYVQDGSGSAPNNYTEVFKVNYLGNLELGNNRDRLIEVKDTAHDTAGKDLIISAGDTTAGTTNNIAGGDLIFEGGIGKGTGAGGAISFKVANAGSSGSTLNTLATAMTIADDGTLEHMKNSDAIAYHGRAAIGYSGHSDYAAFGHLDTFDTGGYALLQYADGRTFLNAEAGQSIRFRIHNNDKMILTNTGKVGIGTDSPSGKLTITDSGHDMIHLNRTVDNEGYGMGIIGRAGNDSSTTAAHEYAGIFMQIEDHTAGAEKGSIAFNTSTGGVAADQGSTHAMQITSDNKVGIGTSSPTHSLHVVGNAMIQKNESDSENLMLRLRDSSVNTIGERIGIEGYWNSVPAGHIEFELTNVGTGAAAMVFSPHSGSSTTNEALRIAADGVVTTASDLTVGGNLTVSGTTTTLNTATLTVEDNIIVLNSNVTGTPADVDAGIEVERGDETNPTFVFDEGQDIWNATTPGSGNSFIANNANGYIALGPQNSSYAHITTDRGRFYFNRDLVIGENAISSYNGDFAIRRNQDSQDQITVKEHAMSFTSDNNVVMSIDGTNKRVGINEGTPQKDLHIKNLNEATILLQKSEAGEHYPRATVQSAVNVHAADIAGALSANATSMTIDGSGASSFASSGRAEIRATQDTFTYTGKTDNGDGTFTLTGIPSSGDNAIAAVDDNAVVINHPETFTIDGGSGQSAMPTSGTYYIHRTGDSFTADYSFNSGTGIGTFTNVVGLRESLLDGDIVDSDSPTTAVIGFMGNDQSGSGGRIGSSISHVARSAFGDYRLDFGAGSYLQKDPYYQANEFNYSVETEPRMSILDNGLVGIGTTSPATKLHVSGSGVQKIKVESTDNEAAIELASDSSGPWVMYSANSSDDLRWYGNSAVRMVLTSAGYLGIGADTSPDYPLSISSASGLAIQTGSPLREKRIYATTSNDGSPFDEMVYHSKGSTGGWSGQHTFMVDKNGSSTYEALRIRDSGDGANSIVAVTHKLGIGTTSPDAPLHVKSTATGTLLLLESTEAGNASAPTFDLYRHSASPAVNDVIGNIKFTGENDNDEKVTYGEIINFIEDETDATENAAFQFKLYEMGTPRENLRIASNQITFNNTERNVDVLMKSDAGDATFFADASANRVGIGTNSPSTILDVAGDITAERLNLNKASGFASIEVGGPSGAFIDMKTPFSDDFDARLITDGNGLDIIMAGASKDITLKTNGTQRVKVEDALTTVNTTLLVSNTLPELKLIDTDATNDPTARIINNNGSLSIRADSENVGTGGHILFETSGSEKMRLSDAGNLGINVSAPSYPIHIDHNATNPATDGDFAIFIDHDSSGSGATGGDREQGGLYIDADSSATGGDQSNEHRLYGIWSDTRLNGDGDADAVYAVYGYAETQRAGSPTTATTNVAGGYFVAASDDSTANSTVSAMYGSLGYVSLQDTGIVSNAHGARGQTIVSGNRATNLPNIRGVSSEVDIGGSRTGGDITITSARVYEGFFDHNVDTGAGDAAVVTDAYMWYGNYSVTQADQVGTKWGMYQTGEDKNYFSAPLGINDTTPSGDLDIIGGGGGNGDINLSRTSGATVNVQAQASAGIIGTTTNHNFQLKTNGSVRATVTTAGLVGIGDTTPNAMLKVESTDGSVPTIYAYRNDSSTSNPLVTLVEDSVYADNATLYVRTDRTDGAIPSIQVEGGAVTVSGPNGWNTWEKETFYRKAYGTASGDGSGLYNLSHDGQGTINNFTLPYDAKLRAVVITYNFSSSQTSTADQTWRLFHSADAANVVSDFTFDVANDMTNAHGNLYVYVASGLDVTMNKLKTYAFRRQSGTLNIHNVVRADIYFTRHTANF